MAIITEEITLDISHPEQWVRIRLQQGDANEKQIDVNITDDGDAYIIPTSGVTVVLEMMKPDNNPIYNTCSVVDNKARFLITEQMTAASGMGVARIKITDSATGGEISTIRFYMHVDKEVINESIIVSSGEFTALTDALLQLTGYQARFNQIGDLSQLNTTSNTDLVDAVNEINTKASIYINVKSFGAKGDGTTDDTIAVQSAIDHCLSFTTPIVNNQSLIPSLIIDGSCLVSSPLIIDRPENQSSFFRIIGAGKIGGFVTNSPITIFNTNYVGSFVSNPANSVLSNQVSLENLTFTSYTSGASVIALNKFVRTQIKGCFFGGIPLSIMTGDDYIQSAYITDCFARDIRGKFISSVNMYDTRVTDSLFEVVADTVIYAGEIVFGCSFNNNLVQNCQKKYINVGTAYGVEINGNYAEANTENFVKIDNAYGVVASGNYIDTKQVNWNNTDFYEIYIGECYGFTGFGNYFSHRGYQFTGTNKKFTIGQGDYAGDHLVNGITHNNIPIIVKYNGATNAIISGLIPLENADKYTIALTYFGIPNVADYSAKLGTLTITKSSIGFYLSCNDSDIINGFTQYKDYIFAITFSLA